MRLHGGFIAKTSSKKKNKNSTTDSNGHETALTTLNDDSMSSNCSSNNSFSSSLSSLSFFNVNNNNTKKKDSKPQQSEGKDNDESMKRFYKSINKPKQPKPIQLAQHNLMKHNQKLDYDGNLFTNGMNQPGLSKSNEESDFVQMK